MCVLTIGFLFSNAQRISSQQNLDLKYPSERMQTKVSEPFTPSSMAAVLFSSM